MDRFVTRAVRGKPLHPGRTIDRIQLMNEMSHRPTFSGNAFAPSELPAWKPHFAKLSQPLLGPIVQSRHKSNEIGLSARVPIGDLELCFVYAACDRYGFAVLGIVDTNGNVFTSIRWAEELAALSRLRDQMGMVGGMTALGNRVGCLIDEKNGSWIGMVLGLIAGIVTVAAIENGNQQNRLVG